jgi:hypothetical protein
MHYMGRRLAKRSAVGMVGVVATGLLHSLFFAVVMWSAGVAKVARLPEAVGAGANSGNRDGNSSERMIVIQFSMNLESSDSNEDQAPLLLAEVKRPSNLEVTGPDSMPLPPLEFDDEGVVAEASDADLIARTKLSGLYESQIRARIERAWVQPPKEMYAAPYSCRVKVRQARDGRVEDVSLENCEGSFEWLDSLVKAIYTASPLPGAPHPRVFAGSFSMQFRSAEVEGR